MNLRNLCNLRIVSVLLAKLRGSLLLIPTKLELPILLIITFNRRLVRYEQKATKGYKDHVDATRREAS